MKTTFLAVSFAALIASSACHKSDQTSPSPALSGKSSVSTNDGTSISPEDLGRLGAKINKHPSDASKLLSEQGMTQAAFETAIRRVSSDPAASKRYAAAYKSAS